MRTISLVKRLKWSFSGNMNPHALVVGDIDDDNENEFVIGNLNGDLAMFKGQCEDGFPSYVCRGLGTITCIAIGNVRNNGKNSVVVINAEGHAHIFDIPTKQKVNTDQHISVDDYLRGGRRSSDTASVQAFRRMMTTGNVSMHTEDPRSQQDAKSSSPIHDLGKPNLTLKVPVNVNKILIADIDNDGLNELILARTDRILHAFQLLPSGTTTGHIYKGVKTPSSLSPSASSVNLQTKKTKEDSLLDKNMWIFDGQISSLCATTHPHHLNEPLLLVAQPGNTFTMIDKDGKRYNRDFTPQKSRTLAQQISPPPSSIQDEYIVSKQEGQEIIEDPSINDDGRELNFKRSNYVVRNWPAHVAHHNDEEAVESGAVATEIVMGKRHLLGDTYSSSEVGMLSMDGKFSIYDLKTETISQKDLYVTHKLFSLATLDVSSLPQQVNYTKPSGIQTPMSSNSHLRFSTTPHKGSLNSRSSSFTGSRRNSKHVEEHTSEEEEEEDSDYESEAWSENGSELEDEPGCDLFVACAWNGVTYLIDWSKKEEEKIKYQLVKFAFEGRVCAFTAGLYSVENYVNVPCLFYVDFEDQIYVYYDVRITPGPVTGFIDTIDDDVEEALDRIIGIESGIEALLEQKQQQQHPHEKIDLGDGWQGIAEEEEEEEEEEEKEEEEGYEASQFTTDREGDISDTDPLNLAEFIHECLYGFHDMKERMESEILKVKKKIAFCGDDSLYFVT
ncbi:uncharacterized protein B0P05DRAFT_566251 [Gilbertella persicaria]|uniref:uncharacterized protein n=1 Tax=Gilbertella persicaria TaxID=101096 RepID=UPI002220FEDB|nr:uncharacterized protein B0P05DRAFT_566251 [Gilbertella persicaria]KAI8047362.1 hypothetical protein B0P05DRAFT_566251 [Gilbertella persicaria]